MDGNEEKGWQGRCDGSVVVVLYLLLDIDKPVLHPLQGNCVDGFDLILWAWPALTDIHHQRCCPGEDVHHGDHGTQAASRAPIVYR
jgi:hypothetical protein